MNFSQTKEYKYFYIMYIKSYFLSCNTQTALFIFPDPEHYFQTLLSLKYTSILLFRNRSESAS